MFSNAICFKGPLNDLFDVSFVMFFAASIALLRYRFQAAMAPYKQDDDGQLGVSLSNIKSMKSDSSFESNDV